MAADFALKVSLSTVDRLTAPMARMQSRLRTLFAPIQQINSRLRLLSKTSGLPELWQGLGRVRGGLLDVGREIGALGRRFTFAAAAGVGAAAGIVLSFARAGDSIGEAAARIGIGVESLQEYRFAAERAGVEQDALDRGLEKFAKNIGESGLGIGEARLAFRALGIEITDTEGKLRPVGSLFEELADRLSTIEDQSLRAALAAKFFGRGAGGMSVLLQGGSKNLRDMAAEARRLGVVIGEENVRAAEAFDDAHKNMTASLLGLRNVIGAALLPDVQRLVEWLTELFVRIRPKVAAFTKEFMAELPGRLAAVRGWLAQLRVQMEPLIALGRWLVTRFGPVRTIFAALAVVIGAKLIVAIAGLVTALGVLGKAAIFFKANVLVSLLAGLGKLFGLVSAFIATPFGAVVAGVFLLATAAAAVVKHWGPIKGWFRNLWDGVKLAFRLGISWAKDNIPGFSALAAGIEVAWEALPGFFARMWDKIRAKFLSSIQWITDRVQGLEDFLPDWLRVDLGFGAQRVNVRPSVHGIGPSGAPASEDLLERLRARHFGPAGPPIEPVRTGSQGGLDRAGLIDALRELRAQKGGEAHVRVDFENLPKGARPRAVESHGLDLELSAGYAMLGG